MWRGLPLIFVFIIFVAIMEIREKIVKTLILIAKEFEEVSCDSYIIGASALILSGYSIGNTTDIDILTTHEAAEKLKSSLNTYIEVNPETKEDNLFRSNFARYNLPLMDIEVMGDLEINKNGLWKELEVNNYQTLLVNTLSIKVPTLEEQIRILSLFGREKDIKRISLLKHYL